MTKITRPISWIKAARKTFEDFPAPVQKDALRSLTVAADGHMDDHVKPLKGFDDGVMEIVLRHRGGCVPRGLCRQDRGHHLGHSCVSEKIDAGYQDPEARNRPGS